MIACRLWRTQKVKERRNEMRRKKNCSNAPLRRAIKALKENRLWQFILMEINSSTREINFPHSTANSLLTIVGWINVSAKIDWFPSELLDDQMYILARSRFFILFKTRQNLTSFSACRGNGGGWKTYNYCLRRIPFNPSIYLDCLMGCSPLN